MTPAARVQAAIEILDRTIAGDAAEKALTNWARGARYAGSKDRAAVRDHVFDTLRCWRSSAALGGGETGRARMIGLLRGQGSDLDALFSGQGHGPTPIDASETGRSPEGFEAWDVPDWIGERLRKSLGEGAEEVALALRHRAPVFLRVNLLKADMKTAQARLSSEGIETEPHPLSPTALLVTEGARRVSNSEAFVRGMVELQDVASQAVIDALPLENAQRVLDYCAGGGGKSLALAARLQEGVIHAHDANPKRMSDLPERARRAGANVVTKTRPDGLYDLVLCDVPCSGSGAWRRSPEGKWRLTAQELGRVCETQAQILDNCTKLVKAGGVLAYATCSVLRQENHQQVADFLDRHDGWEKLQERQFLPNDGGDGFFVAAFRREEPAPSNH
ncbi:RsmB/NOP family class I SAM-dependent RNA methyltransferase [Tropicibacter naphthalenivorans]|uniref:Ribosomal RNA small subunit methyltransferase B n=1 Tax=Tropicibacter naphthalenivorans TaxID=441103 RepID=A0A0P1GFB7_9RHOB|nr:RsmB/NOP family class I SAM-dependent RNA methyltransferase [Tropicibacter naphthalenivorans]CUH80477.1 Ribosomal RNA small subunit methyltransferase B [Tropicibacter naphthalenivorans]SMC86581.1 16S rRNA (cytosine967-C5)-methyltransferase [Tropicibacter naphthalenivorans]